MSALGPAKSYAGMKMRAGSRYTASEAPTQSAQGLLASGSVAAALEFTGTCIEGLPDEVLDRLLVKSLLRDVDRGRAVFPARDQAARVGLVLQGTVRCFLTGTDGRQVTVRYARRGALVGKYATMIGAHPPLGVHAFSDCTVLEFDTEVFAACASMEISLASRVMLELGRRYEDIYAAVGDSAFGSVRQRMIRHLLALGEDCDQTPFYRVPVTQQQLADAVGSSREVIARELAGLRADGLVRTGERQIELLSAERLVSMLNSWQPESPH